MPRATELLGVAMHLQHLQGAAAVEVSLGEALADHRRVLRHPQFAHEGAVEVGAQLSGQGLALGQQALA
ncbi:hypothetical protein D3C77_806650 [compost metagenome]